MFSFKEMLNNAETADSRVDDSNSSPPVISTENGNNPSVANVATINKSRYTGVLKCYSIHLGYGFVLRDGTSDNLLVPASGIITDISELDLSAEWPVEFEIVEGPRGQEADRLVMLNTWPNATSSVPLNVEESNGTVEKTDNELLDFVNESSPEPLLEPDENCGDEVKNNCVPLGNAPKSLPDKKTNNASGSVGIECGITARVKWFNCKRWHGTLIREDNSNVQIFVRLSEEAIANVKKKGIVTLESHQRVSVDIDWSSCGNADLQDSEVAADVTNNGEGAGAKKVPPSICTDLRLLDNPAGGDLRKDLNAKFKAKEETAVLNTAKPTSIAAGSRGDAPGSGLTARQIRRRREKERKREREREKTGGDPATTLENPAKKPAVGDGLSKTAPIAAGTASAGSWRAKPPINFVPPVKTLSSTAPAVKRGPPQPRLPPPPPPSHTAPLTYGARSMAGGMSYRQPPENLLANNRRGRSPPSFPFGSYYGDRSTSTDRMMQMPYSNRPGMMAAQVNRYEGVGPLSPSRQASTGQLVRTINVGMPSIIANRRSLSPPRYGTGVPTSLSMGQYGQYGGHIPQQKSQLIPPPPPPLGLFNASRTLNPYIHQQREAPSDFRNRGNLQQAGSLSVPQVAASMPVSGGSWRYFDPRASAAISAAPARFSAVSDPRRF